MNLSINQYCDCELLFYLFITFIRETITILDIVSYNYLERTK